MGFEFSNEQIYCIYEMEHWWHHGSKQLYEISGAAGTGKTTLIRYLIERIGLDLSEVAFIAYTGKAASQMIRNGLPGRTIHSLIYRYKKRVAKDENGHIMFKPNGKPIVEGIFEKVDEIDPHIKLIVIDEAPMVNEVIGKDILSYNLPTVALGDLNQLPPVFGKTFFLREPNFILTQIMRQAEGSPIVYLAHRVLNMQPITVGVYGTSYVIPKADISDLILTDQDIILTATNKLRFEVNRIFRDRLLKLRRQDIPNIGEKIICRKNNWNKCVSDIYLTNGLSGFVDHIDMESYNGRSIKIDFRPDFMKKSYKNLKIDFHRLMSNQPVDSETSGFSLMDEKFEFAYAITTHLSQGSQYSKVLFLNQPESFGKEDYRRLYYTAITRARDRIGIVL